MLPPKLIMSFRNRDTVIRLSLDPYPRHRLKRDIVYSFGDLLGKYNIYNNLEINKKILIISDTQKVNSY